MRKLITLILGIAFVFGCTSNNNSNSDSSTYNYTQGANITDIDGNSYPTIVTNCSNQTWLQKNLNVSHYRNGDIIPQVTDPIQCFYLTTGAWCYYNNDPANGAVYGKLYNWYAVNDPRGLAPAGYHIPSNIEWTTLTTCLGGEAIAGGMMKENGTAHWGSPANPNVGASNGSGFTGLPGGYRFGNGDFGNMGAYGIWWSSSEFNTVNSWGSSLSVNTYIAYLNYGDKTNSFSVRCIKD